MTVSLYSADGVARRRDAAFELSVPAFEVGEGEVAAVVGPSGSGKTSLFIALFGLVGSVDFAGTREFRGRPWPRSGTAEHRERLRADLCVVPQDAHAAFDPLRRLGPQLASATGPARADRIEAALGALGRASGLLRRFPHELSGGELRSALLAVAIARGAAWTVADEPSVGLDAARTDRLADELRRVAEDGRALLVATHDLALAERLGATPWRIEGRRLMRGQGIPVAWPEIGAAPAGAGPLLELEGVGVDLGGAPVFDGLDFRLGRGESVAIVGASGAGKTTLARLLAGRIAPTRGVLQRHCRPTGVQLVSQDAAGSLTPHLTGRQLVTEVAVSGFDLDAELESIRLPRAALDRRPDELSGGERRRIALLRALAVRPECLVLDEPTADLDGATAVGVVESILESGRRAPTAMIWITHDLGLARAVAHRTITLEGGTK